MVTGTRVGFFALPWLPWVLLVLSVAVLIVGAPVPTAVAHLFFGTVLGGAVIASLGVFSARAQVGAAAMLLVLALLQRGLDRPIDRPPSSQWTEVLTANLSAQHTLIAPVQSPEWGRWWRDAAGAAVYVCARGPLTGERGLDLLLNGEHVETITEAHAIGPRPLPTSVGFYRVPISRGAIERIPRQTLELRLSGQVAEPIEVCGTFSHQPTAGEPTSVLVDTGTTRRPTQGGRFVIELRIERSTGQIIAALY